MNSVESTEFVKYFYKNLSLDPTTGKETEMIPQHHEDTGNIEDLTLTPNHASMIF